MFLVSTVIESFALFKAYLECQGCLEWLFAAKDSSGSQKRRNLSFKLQRILQNNFTHNQAHIFLKKHSLLDLYKYAIRTVDSSEIKIEKKMVA